MNGIYEVAQAMQQEIEDLTAENEQLGAANGRLMDAIEKLKDQNRLQSQHLSDFYSDSYLFNNDGD